MGYGMKAQEEEVDEEYDNSMVQAYLAQQTAVVNMSSGNTKMDTIQNAENVPTIHEFGGKQVTTTNVSNAWCNNRNFNNNPTSNPTSNHSNNKYSTTKQMETTPRRRRIEMVGAEADASRVANQAKAVVGTTMAATAAEASKEKTQTGKSNL